ncbi:hypothetical protein [Candidatus Nitrosocosmicus arcticus]|uniref:hypothetical protein n=1 Tax=Candidatus Nitrosocosmicus arcticus TaxID=2035267 RepID=UPI0011A7F11C|nr:hypothetical protein [Candidatus Nitrosocosmicus arcticus]
MHFFSPAGSHTGLPIIEKSNIPDELKINDTANNAMVANMIICLFIFTLQFSQIHEECLVHFP